MSILQLVGRSARSIRVWSQGLLLAGALGGAAIPLHGQLSNQPQFTLRPGDVIRVAIWREADLSGDFVVDNEGNVVLPMLGQVQVGDQPTDVVRDQLLDRYRSELRNPSIQITPLRRVIVLGEVLRPGILEVDPTISLAAVVALAGGPSPSGDPNKIRIVRGEQVIEQQVTPEASLTNMDVVSGDQIFVGRRSWLERNSTFVATTAVSVAFLLVSFLN